MYLKADLQPNEYIAYYTGYIDKAVDMELIKSLTYSGEVLYDFMNNLSESKLNYKYAPEKWTLSQVLQHIIDVERVFAYRALRFARQDKTPLPGFNENDYADIADTKGRILSDFIDEYKNLRGATISLFKSFNAKNLTEIGSASGTEMSVRALGFVIVGHEQHHLEVIKERYL